MTADDPALDTIEGTLIAKSGERAITIARTFDASCERVFEAYTNSNLFPKWWEPRRYTTTLDEMDVRPGGRWRFITHDVEDVAYSFHGVYHDVVAPERFVQTFEYEGTPGRVSLETVGFEKLGSETRVMFRDVFQRVEDRDAKIEEGMEDDARETREWFAALLANQQGEDTND